ncbi:hypothetical protein ACHQM5_002470 [Ranunculus cassubicifolius]
MAGLQRSEISFRRQGSSGLVWEDRLVSGELKKKEQGQEEKVQGSSDLKELSPNKPIERSRSNGGRNYRTGKVTPSLDPPSPKVSGCGFCGAFSKPAATTGARTKTKTKTTVKR